MAKDERHQTWLARLVFGTARQYRLTRAGALGLAAGAALLTLRDAVVSLQGDNPLHKDFVQEYVLARATAEGANPYVAIRTLAERYIGVIPVAMFEHPTPHPPSVGVLLLPLAAVDYASAAAIWLGSELLCVIISAYLLVKVVGRTPSVRYVLVITIVLLAWSPVYSDLISGQLMLALLTLLVAGLFARQMGRPELAGFLIGLAILLKPIPWPILLLYAVRREWRALAASLGTIVAGFGVAGLAIGWDKIIEYATQVTPMIGALYRSYAQNQSLWTLGWRIFDGTDWAILGGTVMIGIIAPPLLKSIVLARLASVAVPAGLVAWSALVTPKKSDHDAAFSLLICVSILVSPIVWLHYLVLAALPIAFVARLLVVRQFPIGPSLLAVACIAAMTITPLAWTDLALIASGQPVPASMGSMAGSPGGLTVPFLPGMLTMVPAAATIGLMLLVRSRDRSAGI